MPSGLISVTPIYAYLTERGYVPQGEAIVIEGWPVPFLPVYNPLSEEALARAIDVVFGATPTRIIGAEYLAAIMLQTGRPKDLARLVQFLDADVVDRQGLDEIVLRHGLDSQWLHFRRRFLTEDE